MLLATGWGCLGFRFCFVCDFYVCVLVVFVLGLVCSISVLWCIGGLVFCVFDCVFVCLFNWLLDLLFCDYWLVCFTCCFTLCVVGLLYFVIILKLRYIYWRWFWCVFGVFFVYIFALLYLVVLLLMEVCLICGFVGL